MEWYKNLWKKDAGRNFAHSFWGILPFCHFGEFCAQLRRKSQVGVRGGKTMEGGESLETQSLIWKITTKNIYPLDLDSITFCICHF